MVASQGVETVVSSAEIMAGPKPSAEMASEFIREAAVLILVFGPIEAVLAKKDFELSWEWVAVIAMGSVVVSLVTFFAGVFVEQARAQEEE